MTKKEITEQIVQKKLSELHSFKDHPFKVVDDELMQQTVDSISSVGVLTPLIVREDKDGGYEILSGHRRLHACEILGMDSVPVIVKQLDDDAATIFMVDSNLQRENILPSERALAYKMKMDALKRQGERSDLTSDQLGAVDKPMFFYSMLAEISYIVENVQKNKRRFSQTIAFIIRFRFNAVADKRHCSSAASIPLRYRNFKLCLAFCAAKLPSLHTCLSFNAF